VDAVASMLYLDYSRKEGEWLPNEKGGRENLEAIDFLRQFHDALTEEYIGVLSIAEESTAFPKVTEPASEGGLGFRFKWNMGWMHDVLAYLGTSQAERPDSHGSLTFGATYQFSENFVQAFSHDEVVHGKGSLVNKMNASGKAEQIAQLRALYALQWAWPGKKTLFMGGELAQWKEWDCDGELDWSLLELPAHSGVSDLLSDLNKLYRERPSWAGGDCIVDRFRWVSPQDAKGRTLSFVRFGETPEDTLLVVCNFAEAPQETKIGCPHPGNWRVILDTADQKYGGFGGKNQGLISTCPHEAHGFPQFLQLHLPSLSVLLLELEPQTD
ncbi:MAG: alpha amylase C-terminal domain-containing protein, partial [Opitutales bacterium]